MSDFEPIPYPIRMILPAAGSWKIQLRRATGPQRTCSIRDDRHGDAYPHAGCPSLFFGTILNPAFRAFFP